MVTVNDSGRSALLLICRDFSTAHTITSLSKALNMSRVGTWKILKHLESENLIALKQIGSGKTSASIIKLQWDNIILKKSIELYLTEESLQQKRWKVNFAELENAADFTIIYGSILKSAEKANDIDIINIANKKNFVKLQSIIDKVQKTQVKKIHSISFTEAEFLQELKNNKAFINSIKTGVILFGQEKFIKFIEREHIK